MGKRMLDIKSLSVNYGNCRVVDQVDLDVRRGEVVALIGPNGAGKTTLIKAVSGVIRPENGRVLANELNTAHLSPAHLARLLAVVPQARNLPETFTVRETVLFGRTPYLNFLGQPSQKDNQRVEWALERTETLDLAERPVGELSGGEQQRVLLARALAQDTPILLLDEPTSHLDLRHQSNILKLVQSFAREQGLAVLMALHDLNLVGLYADRAALLVGGKLQAFGAPEDILTEDQLRKAYQTPVNVTRHPYYGTPLILPDGVEAELPPTAYSHKNHDLRSC